MRLGDLDMGELFILNKHTYRKGRKLNSHSKYPKAIFDCTDEEYRHRPFGEDAKVEPCQKRLEVL